MKGDSVSRCHAAASFKNPAWSRFDTVAMCEDSDRMTELNLPDVYQKSEELGECPPGKVAFGSGWQFEHFYAARATCSNPCWANNALTAAKS